MIDVFLAIACSVLVSALLKLARRFAVDVGQAIAWNYAVASVLVALVLQPDAAALRHGEVPWLALVGLGLLLPTIFLALGASVRHAGIVRSDAAQRLSLLLSLPAAFVLFGESLRPAAAVGIVLGLLALAAMLWRPASPSSRPAPTDAARWLYPLLVLAGFGIIDILFKRVAQAGVPLATSLQAMFALALPVAFALALWRRRQGGARFTARSLLGGVLLGLFNFGNILFYLRGHRAMPQHPAVVFASMNIGVVALGALVGMALFRERLSRLNLAGVLLAALAIGCIALP
ncbi:EamA/RhaT family transporter [Rhodanobacter caeni]|uniref:EamA domain-containing protein n=1 Tax=Rhodanobacter caeni TaxID=657654 RepID=A0ABN0UDN0_9GAMM